MVRMDLRHLTRSVQEQLAASAAVGDEPTRQAASMLSLALEPALRLALQDAVAQVAAEVSAELAPGRVELGLAGAELSVRVVPPSGAEPPAPQVPSSPAPPEPEDPAEAGTARITFRPPQSLKARLDRAAAEESLSLNTYLVRALTAHLDQPAPTAAPAHGAGRTSGWFL
jgi:predicted HicB family RNase H-like nuclease